jgi:hypothetical protein
MEKALQKDPASKNEAMGTKNLNTFMSLHPPVKQAGTLLGTALVQVSNQNNKQPKYLRVLIDPGSQATFITTRAAAELKTQSHRTYAEISGVGGTNAGVVHRSINLEIKPKFPSVFKMKINALVLDVLTTILPEQPIDYREWNHINNLVWADPTYNTPGPIDILLGANHFSEIVLDGIIKGNNSEPMAQQTEFGWVISGKYGESNQCQLKSLITSVEVDAQLKRFWEIEELSPKRLLTPEEL